MLKSMKISELYKKILDIWDRRLTSNKIYRHDIAPHEKWRDVPTFPKHFHNGSEDVVVSSNIDDNPELAVKEFLRFVAGRLLKE